MMFMLSADACMKQLHKKSPTSYQHCQRVAMIARRFSEALEWSGEDRELFVRGCYLHDLGKLYIPNAVLGRRGKLTEQEWRIMKQHPACGSAAVGGNPAMPAPIVDIVRHHHERWDGKGYPEGLSGEQIPYFARICSLIDTFDSMMSNRCYRNRLSYAETISELRRGSGTQFDPRLVEPFISFIAASRIHETMYGHSAAM